MILRAISPVIAIIILVAVTIAIAVAVAGWMMGLWTGFTAKPALAITDATLYTNGTLIAVVQNSGQGDADLYAIRIGNIECKVPSNIVQESLKGGASSGTIIKAGDTVRIKMTCDDWANAFTAGTSEQIVLFTKDGSKFVGTVQVVSAS